ncbi:DUF4838 domain-containing protein [Psychroflexus sediminis]|uniref:DUF4838 domain-containing protein n=1 Tax=Psychroflexus sediminis TaxID=470826 RepID=A0A1G7XC85_9FLAO|nr:DUF4838 domain-containing protein [Psychroflexus sediminis]SDG81855.1 protein of unknown function [Psychroflexus sediminis]
MQQRIFIISILFNVTLTLNSQNIAVYESNEFQLNLFHTESTRHVAEELSHYFYEVIGDPIHISRAEENHQILLSINTKTLNEISFEIHSDNKNIRISGGSQKALQRGIAFFLETLGMIKLSEKDWFLNPDKKLSFPSHFYKKSEPDFVYRYLYYPGNFDQKFRCWYQLDQIDQDFGIWGHSFHKLMPPDDYFEKQPELFALYEGERNSSSVCYTNLQTKEIFKTELKKIIRQNPDAKFFSVSQNDDTVYCQCDACEKLNQKYGEERGAHYVFLNELAKELPQHNLMSLAYLHTSRPPKDLHLVHNLYVMYCPVGINRGRSFAEDPRSADMRAILKNWRETTENLFFWDYTVQFTDYFSAFPNIHTFQKNYDYLKNAGVKGVFAQGSADIPSHFYELKQYLLANLLLDTDMNLDEELENFLEMYYGDAADEVSNYLNLLTKNQINSNSYLSIYDNPVMQINTFLSPQDMSEYNQIILNAERLVKQDKKRSKRIKDLRFSLEYTYFQQSKYFGKDRHGMFVEKTSGKGYKIRPNLTKRVEDFTNYLNEKGVYEIAEMGLSPDEYYQGWIEIVDYANVSPEAKKVGIQLLTQPSEIYRGKGAYGLADGVRAYKDFNINWVGWYGNDAEIQIDVADHEVNNIRLNFLENQRHWIFTPYRMSLFGIKNGRKIKIKTYDFPELFENDEIKIFSKTFSLQYPNNFSTLILLITNRMDLPLWRKRKDKKAMFMLDEIEIY